MGMQKLATNIKRERKRQYNLNIQFPSKNARNRYERISIRRFQKSESHFPVRAAIYLNKFHEKIQSVVKLLKRKRVSILMEYRSYVAVNIL